MNTLTDSDLEQILGLVAAAHPKVQLADERVRNARISAERANEILLQNEKDLVAAFHEEAIRIAARHDLIQQLIKKFSQE